MKDWKSSADDKDAALRYPEVAQPGLFGEGAYAARQPHYAVSGETLVIAVGKPCFSLNSLRVHVGPA